MKKIRKAFTLIEMVIVLFIISLLLLIMIPNLTAQKDNATKRSDDAFKTTMKTQAELYLDNNNSEETDKITWEKLADDHYISTGQLKRVKKLSKTPIELIKADETGTAN
jgi:prepilin-type N-terminal cleavage/methylation domain